MIGKFKKYLKLPEDNRIRVFAVILFIIVLLLLVFFIFHMSRRGSNLSATTQVANIPSAVNSVPGKQNLSKEYLNALLKQNRLQATTALKRGQSSLPTLVNTGETQAQKTSFTATSQIKACPPCVARANSANLLDQMTRSGSISPSVADSLQNLQNQGASIQAYNDRLQQLVREGKLTPAQAQALLNAYRNKREGQVEGSSSASPDQAVDQMLADGSISPETAATLKTLNSRNLTPAQYQAQLARLVREGKLTPAQAQALLNAYRAKRGGQVEGSSASPDQAVDQMLADGSISPETAATLKTLNSRNLTPAQYQAQLARLVREGKLTPAQAAKLMATYNAKHGVASQHGQAIAGPVDRTLKQMMASGAIDPATTSDLEQLSAKDVPASEYGAELNRLVREGKLTPDQARRLLSAYVDQHGATSVPTGENAEITQLQRIQQQQALQAQKAALAAIQQQRKQALTERTKAEQDAIKSAVTTQFDKIMTSWVAPTSAYNSVGGDDKTSKDQQGTDASSSITKGKTSSKSNASSTVPMIKLGSILFAVLDTGVNSDDPGPVMATIVAGQFKGAKLMGGLTLQKTGVLLQFTNMTMPDWPNTITINAVAINPDTARTAIASDINNHYLSRYSALFAASFLKGYATALSNSGTTTTITSGTPSSPAQTFTSANYGPLQQLLIGLGEVGQQASSAVQANFNRPPTIKVDAGVGLGILFQGDVATPSFLTNKLSLSSNK